MKIPMSLLLLSTLLLVSACKKNHIQTEDYCPPPFPLVTKITGTTSVGGDGNPQTVNMVFTYNEYIQLVNITDGKKKLDIFYDGSIALQLTYSDSTTSIAKKKVVQLVEIIAGVRPSKEVESYYEGDQLVKKISTSYTYTNELITEVRRKSEDNSEVVEKYAYKKDNIDTYNDGKGTTYKYKYNDKPNPFAYRLLKFRMGAIDFLSSNSVIEIEKTVDSTIEISKNVYTYNAEGYPLTVKTLDKNGAVTADLKFEYGSFHYGCY